MPSAQARAAVEKCSATKRMASRDRLNGRATPCSSARLASSNRAGYSKSDPPKRRNHAGMMFFCASHFCWWRSEEQRRLSRPRFHYSNGARLNGPRAVVEMAGICAPYYHTGVAASGAKEPEGHGITRTRPRARLVSVFNCAVWLSHTRGAIARVAPHIVTKHCGRLLISAAASLLRFIQLSRVHGRTTLCRNNRSQAIRAR